MERGVGERKRMRCPRPEGPSVSLYFSTAWHDRGQRQVMQMFRRPRTWTPRCFRHAAGPEINASAVCAWPMTTRAMGRYGKNVSHGRHRSCALSVETAALSLAGGGAGGGRVCQFAIAAVYGGCTDADADCRFSVRSWLPSWPRGRATRHGMAWRVTFRAVGSSWSGGPQICTRPAAGRAQCLRPSLLHGVEMRK